jgi:hypothetical protein
MRTCCTCPDRAWLHTGDGAGLAPDLFRAECVGHLVQAGTAQRAGQQHPDDLGRFRDRARVGGGASSVRLAIWAVGEADRRASASPPADAPATRLNSTCRITS